MDDPEKLDEKSLLPIRLLVRKACPCRLQPARVKISLSHGSGAGNGLFSFGWNISLPKITRTIDKGLQDAIKSDGFVLPCAEDLIPVLRKQGTEWVPKDIPDRIIGTVTYLIKRYRARIEGLFAFDNIQKPVGRS